MHVFGRSCSLWVTRTLGLVLLCLGIGFFYLLGASSVQATSGINRQISYQGKLLNGVGTAVLDGTYQMKFSLYSASSGGTVLWTASGTTALPTAIPVAVQDGLFSLLLGDSSASGFWQNTLDTVNWNTDALYLGVTIGSDSEMAPRKRLSAVPQAFNAEQLQGMYASSTASGGQNLFTVNQTENNAATSSRTALLIQSGGTSTQNDFLLRGVNDQASTVFSLNRVGSVTSSGSFMFTGSGTSTVNGALSVVGGASSSRLTVDQGLTVYGNTTLGGSSAQTVTVSGRFNSSLLPSADASFGLGSASLRWQDGNFVSVSSTYATSTYFYALSGSFVDLLANTSSSSPVARFTNSADYNVQHAAWGAYVDRLLVGPNTAATGTKNYSMVINYGLHGLCLAQDLRNSCPGYFGMRYSLIADDTISSSDAFDLAESYRLQGVATTTDVLVFGADPVTVQKSTGIPYDPRLAGVYSSRPGFLLGMITDGVPVALTGRVPTQVSPINGAIMIGDPLTTSEYPGVAMKATKPGMILGYALEAAAATSTIEVFVKTGYSAGSILNTDGRVARLTDDLVVDARAEATIVTPTVNSWGLTFRGSAWDGAQARTSSFGLLTEVTTPLSSSFVIRNASSSNIFAIDQLGKATIAGDVVVGGRLYPTGRQGTQQSKYIFLDDTSTSTQYIATNADGWQANDSYDFAERYYSPDKLEYGDLVVASERGRFHVQRSLSETGLLMGIVSTKPAFIAGRPDPDTYPIALAGRVPTKVSAMNGAIKIGDPLGPSTIPGTAVKATKAGPIVGLALEPYDGASVGKIEVFVNPGWWGGSQKEELGQNVKMDDVAGEVSYRGFAYVEAGSKRVHVAYDSVLSYPNIQVTPRGQVNGGWWTDNYTDIGFDIFLHDKQVRDVTFAWSVHGTPTGARVYRSDGTYALVNTTTGEALVQTVVTSTVPVIPTPQESQPIPPVTQETPTSTAPIVTTIEPVASSTEQVVVEPVPVVTEPAVPIVVEEPVLVVVEPVVPVEEPSVNPENDRNRK